MLENYRDRELRDTPIDESPVRVPPKNTGSAPVPPKNTGTQNPPKNGITAPRKG